MSVYVDDAGVPHRGKLRHHLTADSLEELHSFAERVGIKRCWYHRGARHPHYDVCCEQRREAIAAGALPVGSREIVRIALGLRPRATA